MSTNKSNICRSSLAAFLLLFTLFSCKENSEFNKETFLKECQFSIEENILSDSDEYIEIYSGRWREPKTDSLYKHFQQTHDYATNLQICRELCKGTFMRPWGRGTDSLLIDDFFARAIQSSTNRDEIIELILKYGFDKPLSYQKTIGEICLKPKYFVNDSLKYIALNYAIDGNYDQDDPDMDLIRKYSRERMTIAARVYGADSDLAYSALFQCAQLTQFYEGKEKDVADSLFRYHQTHKRKYQDGLISDLKSDPLYRRYLSCIEDGDIEYASQILVFLTNEVVFEDDSDLKVLVFAEAKIMLLYENARLRYLLGMEDKYKEWLDGAIEKSIEYLSPKGGHNHMGDFLKPDHMFYSPIIDWMDVAYNTPDAEDAYNIALFLKGTSAVITPDLIRSIRDQGDSELLAYIDSLRQNYRGYPWSNLSLAELFTDPAATAWNKREHYFEDKLDTTLSSLKVDEVWKSCSITMQDVLSALNPGESAIEIIKTYPFSGDDEFYDALILNYGEDKPIRIKLCNSEDLIKLIQIGHLYDNTSDSFFNSIINPIMSHVKGKTVFISPDGLFSLVNFSSISNKKGDRVSDHWDIRTCISTKSVCDKRNNNTQHYTSIALFGGLEFEPGNHGQNMSTYGNKERDVERDGFSYLPASLNEVEAINTLALQLNVESHLYTGSKGTEDRFRALSNKDISIIHLATHGFYYNTEDPLTNSYLRLSGKKEDALQRCGLLFTNGQKAWMEGIEAYDNTNGILLGSEIATLDLLNTDLVVLSACNTGLGEISCEGVSGLQMAFKRAGVKSILMTLGKVDDEATAFFMNQFYEKLFSGEDKHSAYESAIRSMRESEKYQDPKYWAQFVLID